MAPFLQYGWNLEETTVAVSDGGVGVGAAKEDLIEVDLGDTVRAIDNMRLVVHEGGRTGRTAHAQNVVSRDGECRSSVSSRGSASAREYQVRLLICPVYRDRA